MAQHLKPTTPLPATACTLCKRFGQGCGSRRQGSRSSSARLGGQVAGRTCNILLKIADRIDERALELATVETLDNGKPIRETMAIDIPYSARHFRYFAGCIMAEEARPTFSMATPFL